MRQKGREFHEDGSTELYRYWHAFAERRLFGLEINDEISRVAKMNMILHDDGHTNIVGFDALENFAVLREVHPRVRPAAFDLILTNPPFGAMVRAREKGDAYMEGWELLKYVAQPKAGTRTVGDFRAGKKSVKARTSIKTEILFCETRLGTSEAGFRTSSYRTSRRYSNERLASGRTGLAT